MGQVDDDTTTSYDVTVRGLLGPAVSALLHRTCGVDVSPSARIVLRCDASYDLVAVDDLLERRGLTVIGIRALTPGPRA
jgi:hypothetical protein